MTRYRLQPGTNKNIYHILTAHDDGKFTVTFHGNDRENEYEASIDEDGRIVGEGFIFPQLGDKRWTVI